VVVGGSWCGGGRLCCACCQGTNRKIINRTELGVLPEGWGVGEGPPSKRLGKGGAQEEVGPSTDKLSVKTPSPAKSAA